MPPTAAELAALVDEFYSRMAQGEGGGALGSMGESDGGVVFQGEGLYTNDAIVVCLVS